MECMYCGTLQGVELTLDVWASELRGAEEYVLCCGPCAEVQALEV
jgi:hypothetical protein